MRAGERRRRLCARLFEPLGYELDGRAPRRSTRASRSGATAATLASTLRATLPAARPARAPLRAGAGARRRQALLGRRRRGREAAAPRRGLAGRPPGARADRRPLPAPPPQPGRATRWSAWLRRGGATSRRTSTASRDGARSEPRVERARSSLNEQRIAAVPRRCKARRRAPRARPRLRRGAAAAAAPAPTAASTESSASTSRTARSRWPPRRLRLDRMPPRQRERITPAAGRARPTATGGWPASTRPRWSRSSSTSTRRGWRRSSACCSATPARRCVVLTTPTSSTTSASRRCRPASCATATTASSGRGPSSRAWATGVAERHGYAVALRGVGPKDAEVGAPDPDGGVHADEHAHHPRALRSSCSIGASGSGKSTFARAHFLPTEVVSSDFCRGLVADDENDQSATERRLRGAALHRRQAPRARPPDRRRRHQRAARGPPAAGRARPRAPRAAGRDRARHARAALPRAQRGAARPRSFGPHVVRSQRRDLRRSLRGLRREGFRTSTCCPRPRRSTRPTIEREPLWNDRRDEHGPFDIIGDVHGCFDELVELLDALGYAVDAPTAAARSHPEGRTAIFLGDLVDRGPGTPGRAAAGRCTWSRRGHALCVPGNHDVQAAAQAARPQRAGRPTAWPRRWRSSSASRPTFRAQVATFLDGLVSHYVLDGGKLVVAHAGLTRGDARPRLGRGARRSRCTARPPARPTSSACRCATTGPSDYRGAATVVYGHTPVPEAEWLNSTIYIDTGCVFGGALTALRYPSASWCRVPARARTTPSPIRPLAPARRAAADGAAARTTSCSTSTTCSASASSRPACIGTRHRPRGERGRRARGDEPLRGRPALAGLPAADDVAVRDQSAQPGLLEHPAEAFAYYRRRGRRAGRLRGEAHGLARGRRRLPRRGGRARAASASPTAPAGVIYTRTGRPFFDDARARGGAARRACAPRIDARRPVGRARRPTGLVLDCELMPWSAKAQELLRSQYAAVGAAARAALRAAARRAARRPPRADRRGRRSPRTLRGARPMAPSATSTRTGATAGRSRRIDDLRLAPFHLLATEGAVHARPRPPLAHGDRSRGSAPPTGAAVPARRRTVAVDLADAGERGGRRRLVGGADRRRRRGHGRQAARLRRRSGRRGLVAAGDQVPRPRVPAHHLRARVHRARATSSACASAASAAKRVAGPARVRARHRGPGALRRAASRSAASTSASSRVLALESEPVDPRL